VRYAGTAYTIFQMTTLAVLSDIHGNRWALEAVLLDLARTPTDAIINLGDTLWGALDPAGTADLLMALSIRNVRGNTDREMLEGAGATITDVHSCAALTGPRRAWLAAHEPLLAFDGIVACHGTPASDSTSLLEEITPTGVHRRGAAAVATALGALSPTVSLLLCGHTHLSGIVHVPGGPLIVNPGSIGLPAYRHDTPCPHCMESGSPHARFAVVQRLARGWRVEHRAIPYDWEAAAKCAENVGRRDWAYQLRTGHVADASH
jgi:predicted phosphodiesterase